MYNKQFTTDKGIKELCKEMLDWCSLVDIVVKKQEIADEHFKITGTKTYRSDTHFHWGIALLWWAAGMILFYFEMGGFAEWHFLASCTFILFYYIYYRMRKEGKKVPFEFKGRVISSGGAECSVRAYNEPETVTEELNRLIAQYIG